jgi:predicted DCC family thiol-disulfide oxidoreductase YuxK
VRLLKALDRDRRVTAVPYQKPGIPASAGLSVEECEAYVWAVTPDGRRYRGAEAINVSFGVALGTRLPHAIYKRPSVGRLQDLVYDWVAANRLRLPGDEPHCSRYPSQCR